MFLNPEWQMSLGKGMITSAALALIALMASSAALSPEGLLSAKIRRFPPAIASAAPKESSTVDCQIAFIYYSSIGLLCRIIP